LHTDRLVIRLRGRDETIDLTRIANARYHDRGDFDMISLKVGDADISMTSHMVETGGEFRDL